MEGSIILRLVNMYLIIRALGNMFMFQTLTSMSRVKMDQTLIHMPMKSDPTAVLEGMEETEETEMAVVKEASDLMAPMDPEDLMGRMALMVGYRQCLYLCSHSFLFFLIGPPGPPGPKG